MLIVNTDHGFLLGEHGWWAKSVQPWYDELVHLPFLLWDPREEQAGPRRGDLARTIDIAPTLLSFFGVEAPADMQGRDLAQGAVAEAPEGALFGVHGGHVSVTDGRYVYMRSSSTPENGPLEEFTLMPTHMRSRFAPSELMDWRPAEPFSFTKGLRTMRMEAAAGWMNPWQHGTLLFDLADDPQQMSPLVDEDLELRMAELLVRRMRAADAPASQFERLGLPLSGPVESEHLLVAEHAERAAQMAEPMPPESAFAAPELLSAPVLEVVSSAAGRAAVERAAPGFFHTEMVTLPAGVTLRGLAASGAISVAQLRQVDDELAGAGAAAVSDEDIGLRRCP